MILCLIVKINNLIIKIDGNGTIFMYHIIIFCPNSDEIRNTISKFVTLLQK